jgi:hypothetical protein
MRNILRPSPELGTDRGPGMGCLLNSAASVPCVLAFAVLTGAWLGALSLDSQAQSLATSDEPPRDFVRAWQDALASDGKLQTPALRRLGEERAWEPYFRAAFNATKEQEARDLFRPVLNNCRAGLLAWNLKRASEWEKGLRVDLLTELAASTDDEAAAIRLGDMVISVSEKLFKRFVDLAPFPEPPPPKRAFLGGSMDMSVAKLAERKHYHRYSGDRVYVSNMGDFWDPLFIHARRGEFTATNAGTKLSLTVDQISEQGQRIHTTWQYSVISVNGNAIFRDLQNSLLICDGNLLLDNPGGGHGTCNGCLIICNGTVSTNDEFQLHGFSLVYASEGFTGVTKRGRYGYSAMTGGKNSAKPDASDPQTQTEAGRKYYEKYFAENVKENPFGVKFVSPADVGVELAVGVKVVRFGEIKTDSPIAKAGLEKGDRIVKLNGIAMETAADFRRQLRESLLWGTGLFEIKRGDQTFLRLVKFAEPPKKK